MMQHFHKREVLQQEYSQTPILPSPHFRWVVHARNEKKGEGRVESEGSRRVKRQVKRRGGEEGNGARGMEEGEENFKNKS